MIVVLSANTAVDRVLLIPSFRAGAVFRAERAEDFAGGKGLNVARVLRMLGERVRVVGTLAGAPGPAIDAWCQEAGVDTTWVTVAGETRTCTIVVDPGSGRQTVLNTPGPRLAPRDIDRLRDAIHRGTVQGDILCISGSAPPGVPDHFYGDIVLACRQRGVRCLLDVSGAALRLALEMRPWAASPNAHEYAGALSLPLDQPALVSQLASSTEHAILTLGEEGLMYAHAGVELRITPPRLKTVNAVGSGDACVAGFLAGMERGWADEDAIRFGVACGASNASRFEPGIGGPEEVERLAAQVTVERISDGSRTSSSDGVP